MSDHQDAVAAAMDSGFGEEGAKVYVRYTRALPNNREIALWRRILAETGGGSVLDVGAGTGYLSEIALDLGYRVVALDRSAPMLEKATHKLKQKYGESFTTFVGDAQDLPFPDESFDVVMSRAALWTLPDPVRMLRHAARVLKPGGVFLLSDGTFKHLGTPIEMFSRACQGITDLLIAQRLPRIRKNPGSLGSGLPLLPQEQVEEELRTMGATVIRSYDLIPCQDLIYRMVSLYWYPYLLYVRF